MKVELHDVLYANFCADYYIQPVLIFKIKVLTHCEIYGTKIAKKYVENWRNKAWTNALMKAADFSSSSKFHQSGIPGRQKCAQSVVPYLVSRHTASRRWADICCTSRVSKVVVLLVQDFIPCAFANLFIFVTCFISLFAGCNARLGSTPFKHFANQSRCQRMNMRHSLLFTHTFPKWFAQISIEEVRCSWFPN